MAIRWTDLNYGQIAGHLVKAGSPVSVPVVKQLLKKHGYVTRKAQKARAMGGPPDRNECPVLEIRSQTLFTRSRIRSAVAVPLERLGVLVVMGQDSMIALSNSATLRNAPRRIRFSVISGRTAPPGSATSRWSA